MQALLKTVTNGVLTKTEAQVDALGGRPDIGVEVAKALCGFVELKAPGHGARTRDFKGRDKEQWKKFSALLSEILAAPLFSAADFRTTTTAERVAPGDKSEEKQAAFEM